MSWRRCSSCKNDIGFSQIYWQCSVSTCNRARTGLYFCSVGCWEMHLPVVRHREAFAVEATSPTREEAAEEDQGMEQSSSMSRPATSDPRKRVAVAAPPAPPAPTSDEILIVVTKLKKYIKERRGLNTSDSVMPLLSNYVRRLCDAAAQNAVEDGRKTVLDRDFTTLIR